MIFFNYIRLDVNNKISSIDIQNKNVADKAENLFLNIARYLLKRFTLKPCCRLRFPRMWFHGITLTSLIENKGLD